MKEKWMARWFSPRVGLLSLLMLVSPAVSALQAQSVFEKPMAVVSIGKLEKVQPDIIYLMRAVGSPQIGGFVNIMVDQYSRGLDRERPAGVLVAMQGETPAVVAYLPLENFDDFLEALQPFGEPDDLGDGKYAMEVGANTVFAMKTEKWLYVGMDEGVLEGLPADPTTLVPANEESYEVSARFIVKNVPEELKTMMMDQLSNSLEQAMELQAENQTEEQQKQAEETAEQTMAQMEKSIAEMDEVLVGWNIDSSSKKTYMDFGIQALEGSDMAADMLKQQEMTTEFPGLAVENAAATLRIGTSIAEKDAAQAVSSLDAAKAQALTQVDENEEIPDGQAKEVAKAVIEKMFGLLSKTVKEGVFDGGAAVLVDGDKLRTVMGGRIADGEQLATDLKSIFEEVKGNPEVPNIKFDASIYKGVTFHTLALPIPDEGKAQQVLGTELPIVIGTGKKSFFIAVGDGSEALLKSVLDVNESKGKTKVTPFEFVVQVGQLLRYAQSIESNPILDLAVEGIADYAGKDHVMLQSRSVPRGMVYRFTIEEGVLRAAGSMNAANAGQ
jgi:hypothetical protein